MSDTRTENVTRLSHTRDIIDSKNYWVFAVLISPYVWLIQISKNKTNYQTSTPKRVDSFADAILRGLYSSRAVTKSSQTCSVL